MNDFVLHQGFIQNNKKVTVYEQIVYRYFHHFHFMLYSVKEPWLIYIKKNSNW